MGHNAPVLQTTHVGDMTAPTWRTPVTAAVLALAVAGCGSSANGSSNAKPKSNARPASFAGGVNETPSPTAPLHLRDSLGHRVDIRDYRGKAVLVTFIYTHCPDVCPLIVGNLHNALVQL